MEPFPTSPDTVNFTASFEVSISTVSEIELNSLQIRENSPEDISIMEEYSVSGIPRDSLSKLIRLRENSEILEASLNNKKVMMEKSYTYSYNCFQKRISMMKVLLHQFKE